MDELITIVDDQDNVIGTTTRGEAYQKGLWHRIVVVFIFNSQGQIFIQKRSPKLISQPGKWDHSVAGHVDAGESSQAATRREMLEELGIKTTNLQFLYTYRVCLREKEMIFNRFWHTFKCIRNGPFHLKPDEISTGKFVSLSWLNHNMEKHPSIYTNGFHESLKRYLKYIGQIQRDNVVEATHGMLADIKPERSWTKELEEERRQDNIREETKFDSLFNKNATMTRKSLS